MQKKTVIFLSVFALILGLGAGIVGTRAYSDKRIYDARVSATNARRSLESVIRGAGLIEADNIRLNQLLAEERRLSADRDKLIARRRELDRRISIELGQLDEYIKSSIDNARTAGDYYQLIDKLCHGLFSIYHETSKGS